jgi:Uma2 family endonuclease
MSAPAIQPRLSPAPPDRGIRPRRWTREEYYRAADLGLFRPEERLELLDGEILEKVTPQKERHAAAVAHVARVLASLFGPDHHARTHSPIILDDLSEPEPDVVIVPGTEYDYLASHPRPADVRLLIEVADTTLRFDRTRKRSAYARAGILEYWNLNLRERQLEIYRDHSGSRHRSLTVYGEQDAATPLASPHVSVLIANLLPPTPAPETG